MVDVAHLEVVRAELPMVPLVMRWVHILAASLAIGVPIFVRFVLTPAMGKVLEAEAQVKLRAAVNAIWARFVYGMIALFLVSGLYTMLVVVSPEIRGGRERVLYDALFGFKMILALGVFFLASALAGRSKALEPVRKRGKVWLSVLIVLVLTILMMSGGLKMVREGMMRAGVPAAVTPAVGGS